MVGRLVEMDCTWFIKGRWEMAVTGLETVDEEGIQRQSEMDFNSRQIDNIMGSSQAVVAEKKSTDGQGNPISCM